MNKKPLLNGTLILGDKPGSDYFSEPAPEAKQGTEAAIESKLKSASEKTRLEELFAKADDAGMTDAEFREYARGMLMSGKPNS